MEKMSLTYCIFGKVLVIIGKHWQATIAWYLSYCDFVLYFTLLKKSLLLSVWVNIYVREIVWDSVNIGVVVIVSL